MSKHLLLTGATGLLGQYLLRDFLIQGRPVAVLIRPSSGETARERMEALMARWDKELDREMPRPVCLEGDVALAGCGLSAAERDWVAQNCELMLHNAASLRLFGQQRDQDPWLSNLRWNEPMFWSILSVRGRAARIALRLNRLCLREAQRPGA